MDQLIAELEAAPEGSRELSDKVLEACGWHHCTDGRLQRDQWQWLAPGKPPILVMGDPDPTRSFDDALILVPAGAHVSAQFDTPEKGCDTAASIVLSYGEKRLGGGGHYTPALATCIAALRARQAMEAAA